jgi:hypothetical protein
MPSFRVRFLEFGLAISRFGKNTKNGLQRTLDGTTRERFPNWTNHFPTFLKAESLQSAQIFPIVGGLFLKTETPWKPKYRQTSPALQSETLFIEKGASTRLQKSRHQPLRGSTNPA